MAIDLDRSVSQSADERVGHSPLSVIGVHHRYDDEPILVDVSLEVAAGESVALLGPSGCGKTTLLRAIAGLEPITEGAIRIGDQTVAGESWVPPEHRRVGMVFQDWALFPHLSVADNVGYGLPRAERRGSRVAEALEIVGLEGFGERMPTTLSGGQQQRVALARALAPRPRLLLLDEPFSNLDTTMRVEVRSEVRRLLLDLGITSIFVTHDQDEAFVVGDRVAVMHGGRIVQVDTPRAVYARPATRWAASFVGDATLLRCAASGRSATSVLGVLALLGEHHGEVDVLLRPEQLTLVPGDEAVVESVEFYGHDAVVNVTLGDLELQVRTDPEFRVRRGDRSGVGVVDGPLVAYPA